MATIVQQINTGRKFVLVGTGFGQFQSKKPDWLFGNILADTEEGHSALVCVSNADGRLGWLDSTEVEVVSVDGRLVSEWLT